MSRFSFVVVFVAAIVVSPSAVLGFVVVPFTTTIGSATAFTRYGDDTTTTTSTSLNGFGSAFSDAFKNDETLGKVENAGLKGGPKFNDQVTINGKQVKAVVGQAVKQVANSARVKIRYDCQQGDCGTCMIKMNGKKVKACQMKIPAGRCVIQTLD